MNADKDGSYLREPSVSEGELKARIEALMADIPLNNKTVIERNLILDNEVADISTVRAKKELEASLGHQIDPRLSITMKYNPNWQTFDISHVRFALPGTTSLTANAIYDAGSDSFASFLYDEVSEQQIARKPIQPSTIGTLLQNDNFLAHTTVTSQSELLAQLFMSSPVDMELTIRQSAVLSDEQIDEDTYAVCTIERTQTYGQQDILDVIEFTNEIHVGEAKFARVISVITSEHGSTIRGEELKYDPTTGQTIPHNIEFDYETLEKLLSQIDTARSYLDAQ